MGIVRERSHHSPPCDVQSNESTTKYLLMGEASSSILVHDFSWLYVSSGGEMELQQRKHAIERPF